MKHEIQSEYNKHIDVAEDEIGGLSENIGIHNCNNYVTCLVC